MRRAALAALPLAFLAVFFLFPLGAVLERSLDTGDLPLDVIGRRRSIEILWFTAWQAAVSTALTLLAALPLTWALSRFSFRGRGLAEALVAVPFVLPTIVVATAFLLVLPESLERSVPAILLAHVFFNIAVVTRIVGGVWQGLDRRLDEAAATLGLPPPARFRRVTFPLLAPALSAAAAVVFLFCFTSFGVIVILGGPGRATLETEIYNQAVRQFDLRTAAALALLQLAVVALVAVSAATLERRAAGTGSGRPTQAPRPTGSARGLVAGAVAVTLGLLAVPPVLLVSRSLTLEGGIGLGAYGRLFEPTPALLTEPWRAAVNSLLFAAVAAGIAVGVALPAAVLAARGSGTVDLLLMLPLGASAAMLGFGFLLAFDDPPFDLRGSPWIVPLAQALVAAPFVLRALVPAVRAIDPRLREAATSLGLPPRAVLRRVDLPLLRPGLVLATGLAFAMALGEFGATVFLARADWPTLPVAIFRLLGRPGVENLATATALSVVLALLTVTALLALQLAGGRRR